MPIGPMDEYLAHQTTETFDYVQTSDRNFYDRYYFNMHDSTGDFFMVAGMGQYLNLGVLDAFVAISVGTKQYVVRASRALGHDRLDTQVGPFRFEVLEGLQSLRLQCDKNEWGLHFDLRFDLRSSIVQLFTLTDHLCQAAFSLFMVFFQLDQLGFFFFCPFQ